MKTRKQTIQDNIDFNFLSAVLACSHCSGVVVNIKGVIKWKKKGANIDAVDSSNRTAIDIVKNGQKPIKTGLLKYLLSLKEVEDLKKNIFTKNNLIEDLELSNVINDSRLDNTLMGQDLES